MRGRGFKVVSAVRSGDWQSKLLVAAQVAVGVVAMLGLLAMATRQPLLLLGFASAQGLALLGLVLFVVVAVFAQRVMVLERFEPGELIFEEGEPGRHVYVIKSGTVELLRRRPDGAHEVFKHAGGGDHFGELALLRKASRSATVRTVTAVEVFKMSPSNFVALYTNLPGFRDHFNRVMESRLHELASRGK